jgi:hypothetical protein
MHAFMAATVRNIARMPNLQNCRVPAEFRKHQRTAEEVRDPSVVAAAQKCAADTGPTTPAIQPSLKRDDGGSDASRGVPLDRQSRAIGPLSERCLELGASTMKSR